MGRKYTGLGPEEREKKAAQEILSLLPDKGEVSWQFLAKEAEKRGISKATLSKHLKRFVDLNLVSRRVDISTYPPRTYYRKTIDVDHILKRNYEIFKEKIKIISDNNIPFDKKISLIKFYMTYLESLFSVFLFVPPHPPSEKREDISASENRNICWLSFTGYYFEDLYEMVLLFRDTIAKIMASLNKDEQRKLQEILLQPFMEKITRINELKNSEVGSAVLK